jgi:NDP-sugar pyrophosphorylase family protein
MEAMVFAAGLGTRLRPLTETRPKALVRVGGVSMLDRTVRRLVAAGAERVVVNVHHHRAEMEAAIGRLRNVLGAEASAAGRSAPDLRVSLEAERPLETGGGLRRARSLFGGADPILLHNVDVLTEIDLRALAEALGALPAPVAVLAVHERPASRRLLFDDRGLVGREDLRRELRTLVRTPIGRVRALAFTGVQVVAPRVLASLPERECFSVVELYLELAGGDERVLPYDVGSALWLEIGTPDRLAAARRVLGDED